RKSLELALSSGPARDVQVEVLRRLGELCLSRGEPEEALGWLDEGLELARSIRERVEEGAILRTMGLVHARSGRKDEARKLIDRALEVLRAAGARYEIALTYLRAVESLYTRGNGGGEDESGRPSAAGVLARDEAWSMLVEASHLFAESGASYWRERAVDLLSRLDAPRRRACEDEICSVGDSIVRLKHNDAYLLHDGFVCVSDGMRAVSGRACFSAECARPVLIMGETGTGKEVVARLVHERSGRSGRPFVAVNCAAIPDHLFESEFFGHRKGCFTGAVTDRTGIFEEAHGGTLFLDEIGELTTLQQVKLLRVLQEGAIRRIGENRERPVDIRLISATNQDIEEKLESASFREDFYYRINAEQIHIPPLRERREDVIPLITYYLCGRNGSRRAFVLIEETALRALQNYRWPGNVRELFNLLERLKDLSGDGAISFDMLPERMRNSSGRSSRITIVEPGGAGGSAAGRLERALSLCGGNKSAAARFLGISRGTLYKELKRSGLSDRIRPSSSAI
ncbi:MAG TPA: tetratricopeptide repeat protein, partial [Candidatus Eisenbacteria bacterium]|nr:tetratricopeptide repeat protein [Candidatus Eisenbacteria bacterium]